jgi:alpha-beta hydrolase superfamily lysophospholipase
MKVLNQKSATAITTNDYFIPSDTAGINLHLRRKHLAELGPFSAERTLLLMHGATFSSGSLFDAPMGGASFMDQLALSGFDAYAVDVRGYGSSTWPPQTVKQPTRAVILSG